MDRQAVGERLKALRSKKTLDEVAKDLGVTSMAVSLWERGERIPSDDMKIRIASYYKKTVTSIFFADKVNKM